MSVFSFGGCFQVFVSVLVLVVFPSICECFSFGGCFQVFVSVFSFGGCFQVFVSVFSFGGCFQVFVSIFSVVIRPSLERPSFR